MTGSTRSSLLYMEESSHIRGHLGGGVFNIHSYPAPRKAYPQHLEFTKLSADAQLPEISLGKASSTMSETGLLKLDDLAAILRTGAGITGMHPDYPLRAWPSAGALYPCELYVAASQVPGLEDGLYHYDPHSHGLTCLRKGPVLKPDAPRARIFVTSIFHRTAWKYGDRAYRYCLCDCGHLLESLVLCARALNLPNRTELDFPDEIVNDLLCIDENEEACLCWLELGHREAEFTAKLPEPEADNLQAASAAAEADSRHPAILEAHRAGYARHSPSPVTWTNFIKEPSSWRTPPEWGGPEMPLRRVLKRRRSQREYRRRNVSLSSFEQLLSLLFRDEELSVYENTIRLHMVIHKTESLPWGLYMVDRRRKAYGFITGRLTTDDVTEASLAQLWLAQASGIFIFWTDLSNLETAFGPRGMRYALIQSGRLSQRLCLGATALGLGSCPVGAFYDRELQQLLRLPETRRVLHLTAIGPASRL